MTNKVEFWVITGTNPVLWSFPMRIECDGDRVVCCSALHLNVSQARALSAKMRRKGRRVGDGWSVKRDRWEELAKLMPKGDNPEDHFSWERRLSIPKHPFNPPANDDRKDFLDWVYQQGYLAPICQRRVEVELLWHQVCKAAMDWLINVERPVDMYFVRLHNWPFREDWRDRAMEKMKALGIYTRSIGIEYGHGPPVEEIENNESFRAMMLSGVMFHMQTRDLAMRTIEAEPTRQWMSLIKRVEQTRHRMLKEQRYVDAFIASARRQWPQVARFLSAWIKVTLRAPAQIRTRTGGRHYRFVPIALNQWATQKVMGHMRLALRALEAASRKSRAKTEGPAAGPVPDVQPVQPVPTDVRDGGADVLQPGPPSQGADGVLVLPATEDSPAV